MGWPHCSGVCTGIQGIAPPAGNSQPSEGALPCGSGENARAQRLKRTAREGSTCPSRTARPNNRPRSQRSTAPRRRKRCVPLGHDATEYTAAPASRAASQISILGKITPWGVNGAAEKTRTSTPVKEQRPQRCASTNSATAARHVSRFIAKPKTDVKRIFRLFSRPCPRKTLNPLNPGQRPVFRGQKPHMQR